MCVHYRKWGCPLPDLEPCRFAPRHRGFLPWLLVNTRIIVCVILMATLLVLAATSCTRRKPEPTFIPHWSACELLRAQRHQLSSWDKMIMAIAMTESRFNPTIEGKEQDRGILQITPIYVKELNRLGYDYTHGDAFSIEKSIEMFNAMQGEKNPNKNLDSAIMFHNRSKEYARKVKENLEFIERYEKTRETLLK